MIRIAIIGMGLIGTSLGMALRSADERNSALGPLQIAGFDQNQRAVQEARGRLAIDQPCRSLAEALRDTHLVVIATPVQAVREILMQCATLLPQGAVVTDTASTKAEVCAWAQELLPAGIDFIGGHPMAGKEQSGPEAADRELFRDAIYCLSPTVSTRQEAIDLIDAMVTTVGAKPYFIDPAEHDAYVAGISHLPFLLSTALVAVTTRSRGWKEMAPLAASGYRDISRLASGNVAMHRDICLTNSAGLIRWIDELSMLLAEVRNDIAEGDAERLEAFFTQAHEARATWLASRPNLRPGEADFEGIQQIERPSLFGFRRPGGDRDRGRG